MKTLIRWFFPKTDFAGTDKPAVPPVVRRPGAAGEFVTQKRKECMAWAELIKRYPVGSVVRYLGLRAYVTNAVAIDPELFSEGCDYLWIGPQETGSITISYVTPGVGVQSHRFFGDPKNANALLSGAKKLPQEGRTKP